jgi:hypothetical protein
MDLIIFAVGFLVSMTVIYGIFSQVPLEISPPEDINYEAGTEINN